MADNLETIQLLFTKRNAPSRGRTSSEDFNDMIDELANDLVEFNSQWNNRLVTLTATIPDGTVDEDVDAITNGLSGKHLYTDATATAVTNTTYYETSLSRPRTILEQFMDVYNQIQTVQNDLEVQIAGVLPTAEQVIISDTGALYAATNVETALAEVMTAVNNYSSSVDGSGLPGRIALWSDISDLTSASELWYNEVSNMLQFGGINSFYPALKRSGTQLQVRLADDTGYANFVANNIQSTGNVGIGISTPTDRLEVYPDTDVSAIIGKAHVGYVGNNDHAAFSHVDHNSTSGYALKQDSAGNTNINAASLQNIYFRIAGGNKVTLSSSGNLGIGKTPASKLDIDLATEDLEIVDAGSTGATEQDWIEVEVGGVTGYIRVYATK